MVVGSDRCSFLVWNESKYCEIFKHFWWFFLLFFFVLFWFVYISILMYAETQLIAYIIRVNPQCVCFHSNIFFPLSHSLSLWIFFFISNGKTIAPVTIGFSNLFCDEFIRELNAETHWIAIRKCNLKINSTYENIKTECFTS